MRAGGLALAAMTLAVGAACSVVGNRAGSVGHPRSQRREQLATAGRLAQEPLQAGKLGPKEQDWPAQISQALQQLDRN